MNKLKKMMIIAVLVAIGSQFSMNLFVEGFIITLSVILLAFCLYIYSNINPIWVCSITAIVSPGFRMLIEASAFPSWNLLVKRIGPDAVFYVTYGIVFYILYWAKENKNLSRFVVAVFLCDFASNIAEMFTRTHFNSIDANVVKALLMIAALRSFMVALLIISHQQYKSLLVKQEHENRYRKLLLITAGFKSEIYFMQKNMKNIEEVMSKSFKAHRLAIEESGSKEMQELTLDVSKDIHEIKKDYIRVIKGLEFISKGRLDNIKSINIKDLVDILVQNTREYIKTEELHIELHSYVSSDIKVKHHFYLMSVLRNIMNNSIEALNGKSNGRIHMLVTEEKGILKIKCQDNGSGISPENQTYMFNPGFSTKFDERSGDASRGLGLTMVKDIVEEYFKGILKVESTMGHGATFILEIPTEVLKGDL